MEKPNKSKSGEICLFILIILAFDSYLDFIVTVSNMFESGLISAIVSNVLMIIFILIVTTVYEWIKK